MPTLTDELPMDPFLSGELAGVNLDEAAALAGGLAVMVEAAPEMPIPIDSVASVAITAAQRNGNEGTESHEKQSEDIVKAYLREIGEFDLLTKDDEVRLGKLVREGIAAGSELEERAADLTRPEKAKLIKAVAAGKKAEPEFFQANLRLVVSIAKTYPTTGKLKLLDHIQEGNIGLMHAVEKFDERKGFKFSTYATFWIRQAISRARSSNDQDMRIPSHIGEALVATSKTIDRLYLKLGRNPTEQEIADDSRLDVKKVGVLLAVMQGVLSLDKELTETGSNTLEDMIEDTTAPSPEAEAGRSTATDGVLEQLASLENVERAVTALYFQLVGSEPLSAPKIAEKMGLKTTEVLRIKNKAISKLSHPSRPDIRGQERDEETEGWRDSANCLEIDTDLFFPEGGEPDTEPKAVCAACPVKVDCLEFALTNSPKSGIWGGTSQQDRKKIKRQRKSATKIDKLPDIAAQQK